MVKAANDPTVPVFDVVIVIVTVHGLKLEIGK
jgi:hypothetical protein